MLIVSGDGVGGPAADAALGPLLLRRGLAPFRLADAEKAGTDTEEAGTDAEEIVRIYSPAPTAAFSRRDTLRPGYARAAAVAREHGYLPVVRPQGGSLAVYHRASVVVDHVHRESGAASAPVGRFREFAARHAAALAGLGVDARVGAVPGEYCPGDFSINVGGVRKIAGSAQRVTRDGWLFSTVIQVGGTTRLCEVLTAAYGELGYDFDPASVGTIEDTAASVSVEAVADAMLATYHAPGPAVPVPASLRAELPGSPG